MKKSVATIALLIARSVPVQQTNTQALKPVADAIAPTVRTAAE